MEEDSEIKKIPLEERVTHKLWKARVNGYEELTKIFRQIDDEKSPEYAKYLGLVKKFVIDSNALGQEKGLEATLAYVENYANAGKTVGEVMSGIVGKCIAAPKTKTRELAVQIALMYIEIEKQEATQEELMKGMESKNPKIVAACISATTLALHEFGSKVINVKPLVKKMPTLLTDRDKTVRDECKAMVVEIFRWIGGALRSQLTNLPAVQVTELETEFSKVSGEKVYPTRFLRSQQEKQAKIAAEIAESGDGVEDNEDDVAPEVDPLDLVDPVNILSKIPSNFYEKVEAKKWNERKEAMDALEALVKAPKLETGDYGDLVRALKKMISKDSNVILVALAAKCLAGLANGLKKRFQPYAAVCVPVLLEKFREKKQNVVVALREAIDAVFISTTVEAILEDVLEALNNKNPSVKAETASFLARAFSKCQPIVLNKKLLKAYTCALVKNLNEPDPTVRDSSAEALGTAMKLVGEKAITPFATDLDSLKMAKIKECCDKAVITARSTTVIKKDRPSSAPTKEPALSKTGSIAPKPVKRPQSAVLVKTKPVSQAAATRKTKVVKSEQEMSSEEIDEKAEQILDSETYNAFADSNWKLRLAAAEKYQSIVQQLEIGSHSTQVLIGILMKKPGLKDLNVQTAKCKLETLKIIAETHKFSPVTLSMCVKDVTDKLADIKSSSLAAEVLSLLAEATSLESVSEAVLEYAFNQKNPKVQQESLLWVSNAIRDFGLNVNQKQIIEFAKKGVSATSPTIRTSAITLFGTLYLFMGSALHSYLQNEKPALKQQIDAEFNKYIDEKPPEPTRGLGKKFCSEDNLIDVDENEETVVQEAFNPQDNLPKIDISSKITEVLINELEDKNWKVRNEALLKVETIVNEAKSIHSNIGDLPVALAHRLVDSNGKIVQTAIQICQILITAIGPSGKQHIRTLFPGMLQGLSDTKNWIRSAAITCINTWGDTCGYKEFFDGEMIFEALKTGSPTLRTELWAWLAEKLDKLPTKSVPKEELATCIPILYTNVEDRNADVRKNASEAILPFMIHLGYESMAKQTEKLKPGSKTVVISLLEKARPNLPLKPLPKNKQAPIESLKVNKVVKPDTAKKPVGKVRASIAATKPTSRKKDDDVDTSPLLVINNLKHQRVIDEQKLRVLKWNFTSPREEFVELLKEQMITANVNKNLIANMFHMDFRYHLKAIEALNEDIQGNSAALISNLDLILKWLTLRFFDTNPSVLIKGLEYLQMVFNMLIDKKHTLLENEASSFIPYLILKVGDSKDAVKNGVKALFKQIVNVYPVNKFFIYIMDGLKSKNARQRTECLDELGSLIENFGTTICQPSVTAALKEVAKHISDRDNSVRNAALNCIVNAFYHEGEKVYKLVGQISDKDFSLMDERLKRARKSAVFMQRQSRVISPPQQLPSQTSLNREPSDVENKSDEEIPVVETILPTVNSISQPSAARNSKGFNSNETVILDSEDADNINSKKESPVRPVSGPFGLDPNLLKELESEPLRARIPEVLEMDLNFLNEPIPTLEEIKENKVKQKLPVVISPPKSIVSATLKPSVTSFNNDSLMGSSLSLEKTINQIGSPKLDVALDALCQMEDILLTNKIHFMEDFENKFMSALVLQLTILNSQDITNKDVLKTYRSLLTALSVFNEVPQLGKKISVEILKSILYQLTSLLVDTKMGRVKESDTYNRVINLQCVKIIEKADHTNIICALIKLLYDCVKSNSSPRLLELAMKCLWRVIKILPSWTEDMDYDTILYEVHVFLRDFPTSWWKQKPSDTPNRTIKTLIHSMAKIKGHSLTLHFNKISNPNESELQSYMFKMLKSFKLDEVRQIPLKKDVKKPISRTLHNTLTDIFQKIGSKDKTVEGLESLHEFKKQYPDVDIQPYLDRSSQFFQIYIEKGLKDVEKRKKESTSKAPEVHEIENPITEPEVLPVNVEPTSQPNQAGDAESGADFWMNRLKKWQNIISNKDSAASLPNPIDNKYKDDKNTSIEGHDNKIQSAEELRRNFEAARQKNELLKQNFNRI